MGAPIQTTTNLDAARRALEESESARSRVERELREAQRDLDAAQAAGHVGSWVSELGPDARLRWSRETYRIAGVPPGTPMTVDAYLAMVHPEDRDRVEAAVAVAVKSGSSYDLEYRIVRGDGQGTVCWVHVMATVERDVAGRAVRLLGTIQDVTARRLAEDQRDRFFAVSHDLFCVVKGWRFLRVNRAFERVLGYTEAELLAGKVADFIHPDDLEATGAQAAVLIAGAPLIHVVNRYVTKDGSLRWLDWTAVRDADAGLTYATARDITEARAIQERLMQSQKLEAIGQLAAGIGHDFNNILSVIRGGAELIRADLSPDDPRYSDAAEIVAAAERAASLTRQLLAFGRKQVFMPVPLDVGDLVNGACKLLRRLIGEHIELGVKLAPDPLRIKADPGQIEQVLVNLAVNARDAMPDGGRLHIETRAVSLDAQAARAAGVAGVALGEGDYALITVRDTGGGMDPGVLERVFEPFFTTKEAATGLGLATAYGIVKQSGGAIAVRSTPGEGTTFDIYLPRKDSGPLPSARDRRGEARGRGETVLLVEDEPMVRQLLQRVLKRAGFDVLEAGNGGDALLLAEHHPKPIHLLLTDMVMPRMNGRQLAERLLAWRPDLRVVYMSGYTDDAIIRRGVSGSEAALDFLPKPIAPDDLVRKVREVLDRT